MDPMNQHYGTIVYKGRDRSGENGDLLVEKLEVFLGGEREQSISPNTSSLSPQRWVLHQPTH